MSDDKENKEAARPENPAQTMRRTVESHLPARVVEVNGLTLTDAASTRTVTDWTAEVRDAERIKAAIKPVRRTGAATLNTLASLIDWTNRFKGPDSALFLDIQRGSSITATKTSGGSSSIDRDAARASASEITTQNFSITKPGSVRMVAMIDYHAGGEPVADGGEDPTARHCAHRGVYEFPVSEAWRRWTGAAGEEMDVAQFGRFLEDNARDLQNPTPFIQSGDISIAEPMNWESIARETAERLKAKFATVSQMIDLGRSFSVIVDEKVAVKVDRQSGRANLMVQEDHSDEAGQPLALPRLFLIAIPVFEGGDLFPIICTFSYRPRGPKLSFDLYDATTSFEDAVRDVATEAKKGTDLPLFEGSPET